MSNINKVKLGNICNPKQWKTIATDKFIDEGYPVYGANGKIGFYSEYTHTKETLLITCRGATCGSLNICEPYSYVNGNAMALDELTEEINLKYLYYYFSNRGFSDVISGSAQPQIIGSTLKNIDILVPQVEEQKKIAEILDKASNLISLRKQQIEKMDLLVKSRFVEMFGDPVSNSNSWNISELGELGYFKNGMNFKQSDSGYKIKFLGVGEFKNKTKIESVNLLSTLELNNEPNEQYMIKKGDIVFVRSNGSKELVGRSVLIGDLEAPATYSGFCIRYRNQNENVLPEFLSKLFEDKNYKKTLKQDSRGANINNLNQQMLYGLKVIVPPIELQKNYVDFVQQVENQKLEMQAGLEKLEQNYKALMQQYFG